MEKNIILKVDGLDVSGQFKYENDNKAEIFLTLPKNKSHYFKKLFDNPVAFNINGKFENDCEFTAFYSHVIQALYTPKNNSFPDAAMAMIDFQTNQESDILIKYKIDIGKLYLNASDVSDETSVKKVDIKFSSIDKWIPNDENKKVFIEINQCHVVISNDFIGIEVSAPVLLKQLNEIVSDLRAFFEVLVLKNDVKSIKKYIYTVDGNKIEEVMRYKNKEQVKEEFLFAYDGNSIEDILNRWFEAKSAYGKIFDYLSGILNESSTVYLELKYFTLAQWIEAYSREYLKIEVENIIKNTIQAESDQELLQAQCQNQNSFGKNLNNLFKIKNLDDIFFGASSRNKRDPLIRDIVCYRNHLTHINIKDNLNNTQMMYLYEILKNLIYILIMQELKITAVGKYEYFIAEIKQNYQMYISLRETIEKCKDGD